MFEIDMMKIKAREVGMHWIGAALDDMAGEPIPAYERAAQIEEIQEILDAAEAGQE